MMFYMMLKRINIILDINIWLIILSMQMKLNGVNIEQTKSYISNIYMYKEDLALNNLHTLFIKIWH